MNRLLQIFFSDEFIQAQQQLARWASEDVVSVVVLDSGVNSIPIGQTSSGTVHGESSINAPLNINTTMGHKNRDYYPSPASTETESSENVMQIQPRRDILEYQNGGDGIENSESYPEYKH